MIEARNPTQGTRKAEKGKSYTDLKIYKAFPSILLFTLANPTKTTTSFNNECRCQIE